MVKKTIGLFVIIIGILLFLSNVDFIDFNDFGRYIWSTLLIVIGVSGIIEKKKLDTFFLIVTVLGIFLLFTNIGIIERDIFRLLFVPLILVIIGVQLLLTSGINIKKGNSSKYYTAIFGGIEEKNVDKDFTDCEITSVFGASAVDFRDIKLKKDKAVINVTCIFGGCEIILPRDYKINITGTPIFGGLDNKLLENNADSKKEIIVNYTVIFGGVEIKN